MTSPKKYKKNKPLGIVKPDINGLPVDKRGRPVTEVDFDKLEKLCELHCTEEECAYILGMTPTVLGIKIKEKFNLNFHEYFKEKSANGKMSIRRTQFSLAMGIKKKKKHKDDQDEYLIPPNVTMLIFLGKNILKQTDKLDHQHTSPDGSMTPPTELKRVIVELRGNEYQEIKMLDKPKPKGKTKK
jgi:hypothetical protein